jgi:hypothetical protein
MAEEATTEPTTTTEAASAPESTPTLVPPPATQLDWKAMRATLPAELRDNAALNAYSEGETPSGFEGLVRSHIDVQRLVGGEKVPKLTADSTPEDRERFYNAIGRPETVEGYDLGDFKPPEGLPWDSDLQTNMMEDFHSAGLTNEQARGVVEAFARRQGEQWEQTQLALQQGRVESEVALKTELGDNYEASVELAGRAFEEAFGDQLDDVAEMMMPDGHKFGDHPVIVRAFIKMGQKLGEHGLAGPKQSTAQIGMTPEQAQAELEKMEHPGSDTSKAIVNKSHPDHKAVHARWRALHEAASAGA